jgi:tetratricopeptide (TPR) repeat protein
MNEKLVIPKFIDSPSPEELKAAIDKWQRPESGGFGKGKRFSRRAMPSSEWLPGIQDENSIIDWLYDFIRLNIKRGRIFDLREVLKTGQADCLGYCKIFTVLGRNFGLDAGVVDVVIDNQGRHVPHTIILVKMADNQSQFIDFWYGLKGIRHQRAGLRVKHGDKWRVEDIDDLDLLKVDLFSYLPDSCVNGITLYIEGNRSLKKHDYIQAIQQYSRAIRFYPLNSRTFYNRAIAYENLSEFKKAKAGYARALRDDSATIRTSAIQPEDTVLLIQLDEKKIPETEQQIYLMNKGFVTGKPMTPAEIARRLNLPHREVTHILDKVEKRLSMKAK